MGPGFSLGLGLKFWGKGCLGLRVLDLGCRKTRGRFSGVLVAMIVVVF